MAKIALALNINVSEIEKARLFEGQKGKYLNATIFVNLDEADQYGNHGMITQDVSREEKDQGVKGPILGNGKIFWRDDSAPQQSSGFQQQPAAQTPPQSGNEYDDDIPF